MLSKSSITIEVSNEFADAIKNSKMVSSIQYLNDKFKSKIKGTNLVFCVGIKGGNNLLLNRIKKFEWE